MVDKWAEVQKVFNNHALTKAIPELSVDALSKKYKRLLDQVASKYGVDKEGANLSGLEEVPPEWEKLVLNILKEIEEAEQDGLDKKEKEKRMQEKMRSYEDAILLKDEADLVEIKKEGGNGEDEDEDDVGQDSSKSGGAKMAKKAKAEDKLGAFDQHVSSLLAKDGELIDLTVQEKRMELREREARLQQTEATTAMMHQMMKMMQQFVPVSGASSATPVVSSINVCDSTSPADTSTATPTNNNLRDSTATPTNNNLSFPESGDRK